MASSSSGMTTIPQRLIVCVDGTWFDPDGGATRRGNITNMYRLYASVKKGECIWDDKRYLQDHLYVKGIGSGETISRLERLSTGLFGLECLDQIKEIYRRCCRLKSPGDEVWLYGFSRGAYVIRAVAGLLHYMRALSSADSEDRKAFDSDYQEALDVYRLNQGDSGHLQEGKIHHMFTAKTRDAPIIRFVGAFDTVKAVDDKSLYDITFNDSIQHMRAVLALNESRRTMQPEGVWPSWVNQTDRLQARSFVQAWFAGAHIDMGGSAERDGLSLYPLQWMIAESRAKGLCLEFAGDFNGRAPLQNPLELLGLEGSGSRAWTYTTENNMTIEMRDIRHVHTETSFGNAYGINLNRARGVLARFNRTREPFDDDGGLKGYCNFAPQGTIIHPSVYFVMDRPVNETMNNADFSCRDQLEAWRERMLGTQPGITDPLANQGFWNDREEDILEELEMPPIRVLVCGNAGVGKSKLINLIFGVEMTPSSDYEPGEHNVNDEIKSDNRPDLIIHDSRGFEAAGVDEFDTLEDFLRKRSKATELSERVHMIWVCADAKNCRLTQTSTTKLFKTMSKYAEDIPVIVVATKMDEFLSIVEGEARREFNNRNIDFNYEDIEKHAKEQLTSTLNRMEEQLKRIGGHFDACIATSMHDQESIDNLNTITKESFTSERVRLLYVRAQKIDIDSKVECATRLTMKIYKQLIGSAVSTAGIPVAPMSTRTGAALRICKAVINCFGLSTVSVETALEIYRANVWDDLANNFMVAFVEGISIAGIVLTAATGAPFFIIPMAVNIPSVVQATMRLTLMLACDMILIMNRAFKGAALKGIVKPEKRDVEVAARTYGRGGKHYLEVHRDVKKLIPNFYRAFQTGKVDLGFRKIIGKHKDIVDQSRLPPLGASELSTTVAANDRNDVETWFEARQAQEEARQAQEALQANDE